MIAFTLPDQYLTRHWSATWVGFDTLLLLSFAVTGLAARRSGQGLRTATTVTATLLLCDAWFDITTASTTNNLVASVVTAAAGEIPLAAVLLYIVSRSQRRRAHEAPGSWRL